MNKVALGELDTPTVEVITRRVNKISDLCLRIFLLGSQCGGLKIRFPKPVEVCSGVTWDGGTWFKDGSIGDHRLVETYDVFSEIAHGTDTPKQRAKALAKLRWIEEWLQKRIDGIERYAKHLRESQVKWEGELRSEIAMQSLSANVPVSGNKESDQPSAHLQVVDGQGKVLGELSGGGGEFPF